jgi:rod shape-determining protein MreD
MTATVFALLALYQFLLFWINGVAGLHTDAVSYWGPVITGTVLWPFISMVFGGVRYRARSGGG